MKGVRLVFSMIFLLAVAGVVQAQQGAPVSLRINLIGPQEALDFLHAERSANYMAMSAPLQSKARFVVFDKGEMTPVLIVAQRFAMAMAPPVVNEEMNSVMAPKDTYMYVYESGTERLYLMCTWPVGKKPRPSPIGRCTIIDKPDAI